MLTLKSTMLGSACGLGAMANEAQAALLPLTD
jgi:hypothetical protein